MKKKKRPEDEPLGPEFEPSSSSSAESDVSEENELDGKEANKTEFALTKDHKRKTAGVAVGSNDGKK